MGSARSGGPHLLSGYRKRPTTSTITSSWLVEKSASAPAFVPLGARPLAQKEAATAVDGFTVEAFGRLASGTSPGNAVTNPPEGASWTNVTLSSAPCRSDGNVVLPKDLP